MRKIYTWKSEYLMEYGRGHILVVAESTEEAREKGMQAFNAFDRENWSWNYLENDDEDQSDIERRRKLLKQDIEVEPGTKDVCFIMGSY